LKFTRLWRYLPSKLFQIAGVFGVVAAAIAVVSAAMELCCCRRRERLTFHPGEKIVTLDVRQDSAVEGKHADVYCRVAREASYGPLTVHRNYEVSLELLAQIMTPKILLTDDDVLARSRLVDKANSVMSININRYNLYRPMDRIRETVEVAHLIIKAKRAQSSDFLRTLFGAVQPEMDFRLDSHQG
jgi:hypothetical protein